MKGNTLNIEDIVYIKLALEDNIKSLKAHIVECKEYHVDYTGSKNLLNKYEEILYKKLRKLGEPDATKTNSLS